MNPISENDLQPVATSAVNLANTKAELTELCRGESDHSSIRIGREDEVLERSQSADEDSMMSRIITTASTPPKAGPAGIDLFIPPSVETRPGSRSSSTSSQRDDKQFASLWCPTEGRNHGSLIEWKVFKCPFCHQNLKPTGMGSARSTGSSRSSSSSGRISPLPPRDIRYRNIYLDRNGESVGDQVGDGLLDLEKERGDLAGVDDSILEVITEIQTDFDRFGVMGSLPLPPGDLRIREILTNTNYKLEINKHYIRLDSRRIIDALAKLVVYYPGMSLVGGRILIEEPYCFIFHHMKEIVEYQSTLSGSGNSPAQIKDSCDEVTFHHLDVLKSTVGIFYGEAVEQEKRRYQQPVPSATFKMLWLLYKPGTTVYTKMDDGMQACVIKSVEFDHKLTSELRGSYCLELWYMNFDGHRLGRCECSRFIGPFEGEIELTSLRVYPCEFLDAQDGGSLRRKLEERGEKFCSYLRGAQVGYHGDSLGDPTRRYDDRAIIDISAYFDYGVGTGPQRGLFDTRFPRPIVGKVQDTSTDQDLPKDLGPVTRFQARPVRQPLPPPPPYLGPMHSEDDDERDYTRKYEAKFPWNGYDDINPKEVSSLNTSDPITGAKNRHRYLLCPRKVIGFILKSRKWEQLNVECCIDPTIDRKAIDMLVLPEERKTMIKALVYRYTDPGTADGTVPAPWSADFIENKGEGQIFLLHGSPGVGKTYTAECIAEATGRPLLSLTCGDIGTQEEVLETRLSKWFRLAEKWGAVMLLDEADVFLERRANSDLERNSLVTVFLRTMEYYRGILFLTTNRVGHFDDAFISRIHVVIRYDNLNANDREKIWTNFFNKLRDQRGKWIEISGRARRYVLKDPEMTEMPWNGREIRNAFQTAVALAEYRFAQQEEKDEDERACLEREDFEKVREMTHAFKGYLKSVSGLDESQRARTDMARNDEYMER